MSDLIDGLEKAEDKKGWLLSMLDIAKNILFVTKGIKDPAIDDLDSISEKDLENLSEQDLNFLNEKYSELKEGKC